MQGGSRCFAGKCHRTAGISKQTVLPHCLRHCRGENVWATDLALTVVCPSSACEPNQSWMKSDPWECVSQTQVCSDAGMGLSQSSLVVPRCSTPTAGLQGHCSKHPECRKKDLGHLFHLLLTLHLKIFPALLQLTKREAGMLRKIWICS